MKHVGGMVRTITAMALATYAVPVWAATSNANMTVSANVASRASLTLTRDQNSVTRFSASQLVFDRFDDQDNQGASGNAGFMYAPYRSETGKNWHLASLVANGASLTLSANVTGTVGSKPLSDVLSVWCGGFFEPGTQTPIAGTATVDDGDQNTDDWEKASTFPRALNQPFSGIVPFTYRLNVGGIRSGTYSGSITYTLTSN